MRLWLGTDLYVFVHDAANAEIILKSRHCLDKPDVYRVLADGMGGDGLLTIKCM